MRRVRRVLTATVLSIGVLGALTAQAQTESLRSSKRSPLELRLATTSPTAGYQAVTIDRDRTIYVAARGAIAQSDVLSATAIAVRGGSDIEVTLEEDAARRLSGSMSKHGVSHLAVFVHGKLHTFASVSVDANQATLANVAEVQAKRLTQLINRSDVSGRPVIKLVPSQTSIAADGVLRVDAFLSGSVPGLRAYQVNLSVTGGNAGQLSLQDVAVEKTRTDFVFVGKQQLDAADKDGGRLASALFEGALDVSSGYLGTFMLRASADAAGSFKVAAITEPGASTLVDNDNMPIPYATSAITIGVGTRPVTPTKH